VGVLSVDEILSGLEDRFRMLRSRDRTIPERQRTLEALFDWSERLLEPDERAMLRQLGVFTASFDLEEAAAVAPADVDRDDVGELVWALVRDSLLSIDRAAGSTRYRMLNSVQAYAQRQLEREGSLSGTAERLARWYADRFFENRVFRRDLLAAFETSVDNVRAVLALAQERAPETAQWLACAIADHHVLRTRFRAGAEEVRPLVQRLTAPTPARVYLLVVGADLLLWSGDPVGATGLLDAAQELRDRVGSPSEGTDWSLAYDRADLARRAGDPGTAIDMARRALETEVGDAGRSRMLNLLGVTQYELGDIEAAFATFEEGLEVDSRVGHEQNIAIAHANLAETALILGRPRSAAEHALACLRRSGELGMSATVGMAMADAAHLAATTGDLVTGVRLAARARAVYESTGFEHAAAEQGPTLDDLEADARRGLGEDVFERERAAGRAMPLPDAIAEADRVLEGLSA
jgi:non-specific serine/threonine protein kinase